VCSSDLTKRDLELADKVGMDMWRSTVGGDF